MKIRIRGNSIRLRLQKGEVAEFSKTRRVEDSIQFGGNSKITYSLIGSPDAQTMDAAVTGNEISVTVPQELGQQWAGSDQVGMEHNKNLSDGDLKILVEKDFQCLSPNNFEDESDMYPNPNDSCAPDYP